MSRTVRIEYPGAWYHVINRGSGSKAIFHNHQQYQIFLDLLAEAYSRFDLRIHAYCLMENFYQLLIQTPLPNLGKAMKHINGLYTVRHNRLMNNDGPLFRGRYKAILIDAENYLLQLSRYIHLVPVIAGVVQSPEHYPWSSCQYFLNLKKRPHWLCINDILQPFNQNPVEHYKKFIMKGNSAIDIKMKEFIDDVNHMGILGSNFFTNSVRDKVDSPNSLFLEKAIGYLDCPSKKRGGQGPLQAPPVPNIEDVINATALKFNVPVSDIIDRNRNIANLPRRVAMYLSFRLTGQSRKIIARSFGNISNSAITKSCIKVEEILGEDKEILKKVDEIKLTLGFTFK